MYSVTVSRPTCSRSSTSSPCPLALLTVNLNPWTVGSRSREQEVQVGDEKCEEEERGRRRSRRPAMVSGHCERESGTGLMIDPGAGSLEGDLYQAWQVY